MKVKDYKKLIQPLEKDIQKECINYLESQGYYVQRLNSGSFKTDTGFLRGVKAGTPDLMAFKKVSPTYYYPKLLFIEVKRPKGILTDLQKAKMKELERYGAICFVIHSLEELKSMV
jgi:hypothetical protein